MHKEKEFEPTEVFKNCQTRQFRSAAEADRDSIHSAITRLHDMAERVRDSVSQLTGRLTPVIHQVIHQEPLPGDGETGPVPTSSDVPLVQCLDEIREVLRQALDRSEYTLDHLAL